MVGGGHGCLGPTTVGHAPFGSAVVVRGIAHPLGGLPYWLAAAAIELESGARVSHMWVQSHKVVGGPPCWVAFLGLVLQPHHLGRWAHVTLPNHVYGCLWDWRELSNGHGLEKVVVAGDLDLVGDQG